MTKLGCCSSLWCSPDPRPALQAPGPGPGLFCQNKVSPGTRIWDVRRGQIWLQMTSWLSGVSPGHGSSNLNKTNYFMFWTHWHSKIFLGPRSALIMLLGHLLNDLKLSTIWALILLELFSKPKTPWVRMRLRDACSHVLCQLPPSFSSSSSPR